MRALLVALAFLLTISGAAAQTPASQPGATAIAEKSDGITHRVVSTTSDDAAKAFNRGLTLLYGFNPDEARAEFARAAAADAHLAIARWGIAMSYGTNINTDFDSANQRRGRGEIALASRADMNASPVERALIEAASKRFAFDAKSDADRSARAYESAMESVAKAFPNDDDVQALAAEAAMDVSPWGYWDANGKPSTLVTDTLARLETVLARDPEHIQANHLLIHLTEESPHAEQAVPAAQRLDQMPFPPGAEHLAHMPAHTYMRSGYYHEAGRANTRALDLFATYLAGKHEVGHEPYRSHDCKFAVVAYMMSGERDAAEHDAGRCDPTGRPLHLEIAIRFRQWDSIADVDAALSPVAHFAHGMSSAARDKIGAAESDARALEGVEGDTARLAAIALRAEIARRQGRASDEIAILQKGVAIQDAQGYSEPPLFFFPVRESLGGAFLRNGDAAAAERVFRTDLARNPQNPRSLFGLSVALEREGRADEAARAKSEFNHAWRWADSILDPSEL